MLKNRRHGHIGLAVSDIEQDAKWYIDTLGFELIGNFVQPNGDTIKFLKGKDVIYELFTLSPDAPASAEGKIDHYSFDSEDIEADYQYCISKGYTIVTRGIEEIPTLWENGIRYFKIESPCKEQIEFCQIL